MNTYLLNKGIDDLMKAAYEIEASVSTPEEADELLGGLGLLVNTETYLTQTQSNDYFLGENKNE